MDQYQEWLKELKEIAVREFQYVSENDIDAEAYRDYYDEGYSPKEALLEDWTYA